MSSLVWSDLGRMDEIARQDSPVHRLDARAKAVVTAAFIVTVASFPRHDVVALLPLALLPVIVIAAGRLPTGYLVRKVAWASPFVLAVGLFSPWLETGVVEVGGVSIAAGWLTLASIMLRFVLTVTAALLLVATTGIHRLCAGVSRLGVPRVLAVQLLLLYRYLFVITAEAATMMRGVAARSGPAGTLPWRVYGSLVGHLLLRALDRGGRVHRSMLARGFAGEIRWVGRSSWSRTDLWFVLISIGFIVVARVFPLDTALGVGL